MKNYTLEEANFLPDDIRNFIKEACKKRGLPSPLFKQSTALHSYIKSWKMNGKIDKIIIYIAQYEKETLWNVCIHELSHYIDYNIRNDTRHDIKFAQILAELIEESGRQYDIKSEYNVIQKAYEHFNKED